MDNTEAFEIIKNIAYLLLSEEDKRKMIGIEIVNLNVGFTAEDGSKVIRNFTVENPRRNKDV